ncbi:MAG: Flp pilus assembly complex ATPase component TadA [Desulfohalobiaceae bacterium]|nr:Flp pilus assembly complex ATPase component TadA [Desulfohalobiaceae bacterium]
MTNTTNIQEFMSWAEISPEELPGIKALQHRKKVSFVRAALMNGCIDCKDYVRFFSEKLKIPVVDPSGFTVSEAIQRIVPRGLCRTYNCYPFYKRDNSLFLAMAEPDNILAVDDIRFMTGLEPVVHACDPDSLLRCLARDQDHGKGEDWQGLEEALADMGELDIGYQTQEEEVSDETSLLQEASHTPVVKMVNLIIMDAIRKKASDIHIEAYEKNFRVRYRLDGVLREAMRPPVTMKAAIVSRLKIMASLNIAEKRLPQDGRIKVLTLKGQEAEFRVSILPTLFGEKIVMRFLDKSALQMDLGLLGIDEAILKAIQGVIAKPFGMFLVTGPTGSGKTTTLYSALMELNKDGVNIQTVEDPVEFSLSGVNQVQVNEQIGLTFSASLRSFLRQDPDIILVGEIRDRETAQIAVKAALTGHLVFSTLHTNDAPSTVSRLLNMGVEGFLLASAVSGVLAQRLARRLCPACKRKTGLTFEMIGKLSLQEEEIDESAAVFEPVGCPQCNHSGYKGRLGIYEMLVITPEIQDLILKEGTEPEIRGTALKQGMQTLRQNALKKFKAGQISYQEVLRITA